MSKIRTDKVKGGKVTAVGGSRFKNAPKDLHPEEYRSVDSDIYFKELDHVVAEFVGGHDVEFQESSLQSVVHALERVMGSTALSNVQKNDLRKLLRQLQDAKPEGDHSKIIGIWSGIVSIVKLAGLSPDTLKRLLDQAWMVISHYFHIGG